jgi:hypothetical protein
MTNGAVIARAGRPVAIQGGGAVWPGAAVNPWIAASAMPPRNDKRSRHREGRQAHGDPGQVGRRGRARRQNLWIAASASPPRNDKLNRHREGRQARGDPGQVGGLAGRAVNPWIATSLRLLAMTMRGGRQRLLATANGTVIARAGRPVAIQGSGAAWQS